MKTKFDAAAILVILVACGLSIAPAIARKQKPQVVNADTLLKREERMVLNLQTGPKSTKFYLLQSLKQTKEMQKNLDRAMRQVEQVDANYAKARHRPDDRTMTSTVQQLKQVLDTTNLLEKQLQDANAELKSDVQGTLIRQ